MTHLRAAAAWLGVAVLAAGLSGLAWAREVDARDAELRARLELARSRYTKP